MAISTYAELQTAVANWLDRTDLTTKIPDFISLAEARFLRKVRHWRMEKRSTASTVAGENAIAVPSDYIEMRALKINTDIVQVLEFLSPSVFYYDNTSAGSIPSYYTVQGDQVLLYPTPDSAYTIEMGYYGFEKLSDSNTTNWLLTYHPDIYLYASVLQAEAYILNDQRIQLWKAALDESLKELDKEDNGARWNGTPLTIRSGR
jgi:hypothetical protein